MCQVLFKCLTYKDKYLVMAHGFEKPRASWGNRPEYMKNDDTNRRVESAKVP